MQPKTILNRVEKQKGFVYSEARMTKAGQIELLKYNLRAVKAYLMREDFNRFWTYTSPIWASKFLREWCTRASRSRIEPMQKIAKMLRKHEPLLLNGFESQKPSQPPCIINLATFRSQKVPTDSADEAKFFDLYD